MDGILVGRKKKGKKKEEKKKGVLYEAYIGLPLIIQVSIVSYRRHPRPRLGYLPIPCGLLIYYRWVTYTSALGQM